MPIDTTESVATSGPKRPDGFSRFGSGASILGGVLFFAGPALAHADVILPFVGFVVCLAGASIALVCALVLAGALFRRPARRIRTPAGAALVCDLAIVLVVLGAGAAGRGVPRINDITTSTSEPPVFVRAATLGPNRGRNMAYDPAMAERQRAAYPDLKTIVLSGTPAAAHARALEVASALGWDVHARDPSGFQFEATARSRLFRFVDDVVVRVREAPDGALIDLRSKSRDGKGDMGVNARRIRTFCDVLRGG
jgi:uncharacterized protein (DUF1499 family)